MPDWTIVASWRVMTARSVALSLLNSSTLSCLELCLSLMSRTIRPRDLSWSETTCLLSASTSPVALPPRGALGPGGREGLKEVGGRALRGDPRGTPAARLHQPLELVGRRRGA